MYIWTPMCTVIMGYLPSMLWMRTLLLVMLVLLIHSRAGRGALTHGGKPDHTALAQRLSTGLASPPNNPRGSE